MNGNKNQIRTYGSIILAKAQCRIHCAQRIIAFGYVVYQLWSNEVHLKFKLDLNFATLIQFKRFERIGFNM